MRKLFDRNFWEGPVGIARIVVLLSATVVMVTSVLGLIGVGGWTPAKSYIPLSITLAALAFIAGYEKGHSKRG